MTQPVLPDTILTVTCITGYWINPGVMSTLHVCSKKGEWIPDPYDVLCKGKIILFFTS